MYVVRTVNGMTRNADKLLWTDGSLLTNTGLSSNPVFVVARRKNQHAFLQTSFAKVLHNDEYKPVHNLYLYLSFDKKHAVC
jgi:hypothetical protein